MNHRRNAGVHCTDLNALVGREFARGATRCHGRRLWEPWATWAASTAAVGQEVTRSWEVTFNMVSKHCR
jgi:hypothetical protein